MQALQPLCATFGIEETLLQSVIEGCEMDLSQTRYLDYPSLSRYCHLVAGVVGEVSAKIFGQSGEATTQYAHTLGQAFQLTNIIRDVGEDALRGRIYLPVSELQQFDVKAHEILNRVDSDRFQSLMQFQALSLLPAQDWRQQKPGLMMASIYRTLLREIEAQRFPVLKQRVALTPLRKLWLAWKMQALGRF
jgi:phytoene synthase